MEPVPVPLTGLLGDETTFRRTFRTPIEKHGCLAAQSFLTRRLKPFMLRPRAEQEVAKGTATPRDPRLSSGWGFEGPQRDLYETVRVLMHDKVRDEMEGGPRQEPHCVPRRAAQAASDLSDPRLLKMQQARKVKQSAKLERLREMLPEMVARGPSHPAVLSVYQHARVDQTGTGGFSSRSPTLR